MTKRIIEIEKFSNGAHRNQFGDFEEIPEGYAVIPEGMQTPNFPFGEIEVESINGEMVVTSWTPTEIPKEEEKEKPINKYDQLRADVDYIAVLTGVEL